MNKIYLLFSFLFIVYSFDAFGQAGNTNCGSCTIDTACPTAMPDGGLCPEIIPDGQVGEAYDFSVTFYMPETISVTDPIATDVTLIDVEITDLINLPAGLEWSCSNPDCTYQPSSNPPTSELGCIRICGTPNAAPGEYTINIRLLADVFVSALNATLPDQEQFYTATITILPPDVPIEFNNLFDCGSISDNLTAIQDFNPEQPTSWSWEVDGQTETGKSISYEITTPGTHDIVLETTVLDYVVTELCINSITDGYCGDVEEPLCNCGTPVIGVCPDPYVSILGTSLPAGSGTTSECWNNLSLPTGGLEFALSVFDEDNGPPLGSQDDLLGDFTIMIDNGEGSYSFDNGNLTGTITIGTVLNSQTSDTLTVTVYENPPIPDITQSINDLMVNNDNGYDIQWYLDGDTIVGATDITYAASIEGDYTVTYTDANGCESTSPAFPFILSGLGQIITDATISELYPNPAKDEVSLRIEYLNTHDVTFNILDALGRVVYQNNEASQSGEQVYSIDVSHLNTGLYFVQIRLDDGTQLTKKLTIL